MLPIVHGLKQKYNACLTVDEINFHGKSPQINNLNPFAVPEFFLLGASGKTLYRWFGSTEAEEFDTILAPLCQSE